MIQNISTISVSEMDRIIYDTQLNHKWWKSQLFPKIHLLEYELISRPRGITLERCINTQCHITAEVLWYCLTGNILPEGLIFEDVPTSETLYINCDDDDHVLILHQGKIYDSCWNAYHLTVREAPIEMIHAIKHYKPFVLSRPDNKVHEVLDYGCYRSDIKITEEGIVSNYTTLNK